MIGLTISHYEILEKLGEGGMGIVYKARDTSLDRTVALKFLTPACGGGDKLKERLLREAQVVAQLDHPNICTVHEIGETDGMPFIVMAYIEGETLRDKLDSGPLKISEIIDYSRQIACGLRAAHRKQITHRDIKSANIIITPDGQAKIMDFGLAKFAGSTQLTRIGGTAGTVMYMSPEQVRGEKVDCRTDIWSFGVVFYEMLTGQLPFKGDYEHATVYSILNEDPRSVSELRKELAPEVVRVAEKMLEKQPDNRYQTMEEVLNELRSLRSNIEKTKTNIEAKGTVPSIAVLPFTNMSSEKEQDYFAEGIAEELINALAHIHDLRVVARTSAFAFKGKNLDIREIGRKLDVKTVLEGSVRKAGNRLRVTAQLISVEDGFNLWSERYDRDMADIFAIQDEITATIVDRLKVTLKVGEKTALRKRSTENLEAYNLYLKGLYFLARPSPESFKKALNCYQTAIEKDPNFAQAYAGMSQILASIGFYHFAPPLEMLPKAKALLQKAISLDENMAEAHTVAASLAYWIEWDWEAAGRHFDRALALNPGDAMAHAHRSWFMLTMNRQDEAFREIKKAQELDPLMPLYYAWSVCIHNYAGRFDEALQEFTKSLEIDPNNGLAYYHASCTYMNMGLFEEALDAMEKSRKFGFFGWGMNAAYIYLLMGDRENAERLFGEMIETKKTIEQTSSLCIALIAWNLGKPEMAFEFLDRAYEESDILMNQINSIVKLISPSITADQRYKALLARMKLDFSPLPGDNSRSPDQY